MKYESRIWEDGKPTIGTEVDTPSQESKSGPHGCDGRCYTSPIKLSWKYKEYDLELPSTEIVTSSKFNYHQSRVLFDAI